MIRPAPPSLPKLRKLTRVALTLLKGRDIAPAPRSSLYVTASTAVIDMPPDVAIEYWDELFCAVKARLRLVVGGRLAATSGPELQGPGGPVRADVLECVAGLDALHATLAHEAGRRQRLEREVLEAQAALERALAELVGTRAQEARARHLAMHDGLTSLPNRGCFLERIEQALAQAEPHRRGLAVLYLDLDDFKLINDDYGHATGDEVLSIVAARLARTVRAEDTVGRLGGDEFACMLANVPSRDHLRQLACKLFDAVSAPLKISDLKLSVRPSIGIAMCPADGTTARGLLETADAAMYRAKRHGSGYAFGDGPEPLSAHEA